MTIPTPLMLSGAPGSPYTRKMLAVLRYRRIPYTFFIGGVLRAPKHLPKPKVGLLPTFYLPNEAGELEAVTDSTPLIRRFDAAFPERKVVPADPALAFLDELLEDYGDEWLTKAMFHYRWYYKADELKAGDILPRWSVQPMPEDELKGLAKFIAERQVSRLYVVGSNDTTAPVIESSYERFLALASAHLETHPFFLGGRPGASDFAAYGQLTQLAKFDPTPMQVTLEKGPRIYAWVDVVDDLTGLEPAESDWLDAGSAPDTLKSLFAEMGRTYVPVMLANLQALKKGAEEVRTEVDGLPWVQQPFPYQGKCVRWLRESYGRLGAADRAKVDTVLDGTGCEPLLTE